METIALKPERKAQLDEYARRHGQDAAAALDDVLATFLGWDQQEHRETTESIRRGHEDIEAGRSRPAAEFLGDLRRRYGFPD